MISRFVISFAFAARVFAQPLRSLKIVAVPETPGLDAYVRDKGAPIALGKAFFWDVQAGSDGRTACASCHFHAGAGHRLQNSFDSTQTAALAAFLRALTDERVRHERAPFDHPELCVPAGHPELRPGLLIAAQVPRYPRSSLENWVGLAAVGAAGHAAPLQTFDELPQGIGADGSRANAMNEGCTAPLP